VRHKLSSLGLAETLISAVVNNVNPLQQTEALKALQLLRVLDRRAEVVAQKVFGFSKK
jgi:hypothetical protein